MKNSLLLLISLLISSHVCAKHPDVQDKPVINIFEMSIRPDRERQFDEVSRKTISASVDDESGTLAMYALKRSDNTRQAYMVELYENEIAYGKHLDAAPYKAFTAVAPDIIAQKEKINLVPQFLGDKHIIADERTINNLVIVEVKPEFQAEFKQIVLPEMAQSIKAEKGVFAMYAATDVRDPYRWYFYEIYASEDDYQKHRKTPHFRNYLEQTAQMSTRKESIPVKPVYLRNKGGLKTGAVPLTSED